MNRPLVFLSLAFLLTNGCKKHEPTHTIVLLDISGSINRLRSKDAETMSPKRLRSIDTFWHDALHPE